MKKKVGVQEESLLPGLVMWEVQRKRESKTYLLREKAVRGGDGIL